MSRPKRNLPLLRLAWRNTRRHTRRTLLTASAVTVAVAALIYGPAHVTGILDSIVDTYARTESGHVRIRKEGYSAREQFLPMHMNIPYLSDLLPVLRTHPAVEEALPRIRSAVLVDQEGANRPGLLLGVDLAREEGYLNPSAMITAGRLPRAGEAEVMVGTGFAEKLHIAIGDTLILLGQTAYRSLGGLRLAVTGLASSGVAYLDNTILIAPIDQVQILADLPDAATEILVFAKDPKQADALADALHELLNPLVIGGVEALSWRDQGPLIRMVESGRIIYGVVLIILLLMASLIIVNTMLMTVMERTREFGMEAALGMRRSDLVAMIVTEGLVIGLLGALAGGVLGTGVAILLEHTGIDISAAARGVQLPFQAIIYPDWKIAYTLFGAVMGMITAAAATLYPAWRAVRLSPAEALRA